MAHNMDEEEIQTLLQELTSTAYDMDSAQLTALHKVCHIIEQITAEQCRQLIARARHRPCLQMFMSDGWSTDIRSRFKSESRGVGVHVTGRLRTEFVVQRTIVKALVSSDEMQIAMKLERPRPLASKKCNDIFAAACDSVPLMKLAGHRGISISLYMQDGLFAVPFGKRMRARHNLFFKSELCPLSFESPVDRELAELRDWVLSWCCCAHSCSRALKWGLRSMVTEPDMVDSVHIVISSLLRASTGIHQSVPEFILNRVVFDRPDPTNPDEVEHLWALLDVDPSHLQLFVQVNPVWDGKMLHVSSSLLASQDAISAVTTVVRYCCKWIDFSETRWVKVGQSGRLYLRSELVGIDGLVKLTEQNDAICKWHLNGYRTHGKPSVRLYLATSALAARPSESVLLDLLEDDRFLLRSDHCWKILQDELQYLLTTPQFCYTTVAEAIKVSPIQYRACVIESSLVSIAYLYEDMWVPLTEPPWKFFVGDIKQNIADLKVTDDVTEAVSLKMRTLSLLGFEEEVASACVLARESSLTTTLVEQFHGSGAQIMHRHPQLEHAALCSRMTVHHCRTLFFPSIYDKQETRLRGLLGDILRQMQNTKYTGPRQQYCKLLVEQVKASRVSGDPSEHALRRSVFKNHNKGFSRLSSAQVASLRIQSRGLVTQKLSTLAESKLHITDQLELVRIRRNSSRAHGIINHMDSVRFGPAEYGRFSELWSECQSKGDIGQMQPPPDTLGSAMLKLMLAEIDQLQEPERVRPDWLSTVVTFREHFEGAGFYSDTQSPDGAVVYRLLLALGQPHRAVFLECHRCRGSEQSGSYGCYHYDGLRFFVQSSVPLGGKEDLMVIPAMKFRLQNVHAVGRPEPFSHFSRFLKQSPAAQRGPQRQRGCSGPTDPEVLELVQKEFPWLTLAEILEMLAKKSGKEGTTRPGQSSVSSGSGSSSVAVPEVIPEDVFAAVSAELLGLKEQFAGFDEEGTYFTVRVLGGQWSIQQRRVPCTDIGAYAIERTTKLWCNGVGWPAAKSFAVKKHQGVENARILSEEMCRLGNWYIKAWVEAGSPQGFSFDHVKASYRSPSHYTEWFDNLSVSSAAYKAAFELTQLCPCPVPQ